MPMPARKLNFDDIAETLPLLTVEEKETLEIMLQEDLYQEIITRRLEFDKDKEEGEYIQLMRF